MSSVKDITGIILAGGKSSRMGRDKGIVDLKGRAMIEHVIESAKAVTHNIIIIANNDNYNQFGFPVYSDLIPERGPIGGIVTGLHYSQTDRNLILSCDIPFVSVELLRKLTETKSEASIIAPETEEGTEPLCAIYRQSNATYLRERINQNRLSMRDALKAADCYTIKISVDDSHRASFININTPQELKQFNSITA